MAALRRLTREMREPEPDPAFSFSAGPIDEQDMFHWHAILLGPEGTPYEGGEFRLDIVFPRDYPFKPPQIHFITKIYHCNINGNGNICADILTGNWSPTYTISNVLPAIATMLSEPNPEEVIALRQSMQARKSQKWTLQPKIAQQYVSDRSLHDSTAREWTVRYAMDLTEAYVMK